MEEIDSEKEATFIADFSSSDELQFSSSDLDASAIDQCDARCDSFQGALSRSDRISNLTANEIFGDVEENCCKNACQNCCSNVCCGWRLLVIIIGLFVLLTIGIVIGVAASGTYLCAVWYRPQCDALVHTQPISLQPAMTCRIMGNNNQIRPYPSHDKLLYRIEYNETTMQANFVYYVIPSQKNTCERCQYFRKDPYNINPLRNEDYTNIPQAGGQKYERGHLVPNLDYGNDTYIISNVVPMDMSFNRGVWRMSEAHLHARYPNKLLLKGCDYSGRYLTSNRNNKLYIPEGCYYFVFDHTQLPPTDITAQKFTILEFGYYKNVARSTQKCEKLPAWLECDNINPNLCGHL